MLRNQTVATAKSYYLRGQYSQAAEDHSEKESPSVGETPTAAGKKAKAKAEAQAYRLGALVFLGRHAEARALYQRVHAELSVSDSVVANFHMGISYTRTSEYAKAKAFFAANIRLLRKERLETVERFFVYQGLSFFHFFFSQHRKSQFHADRGYSFLVTRTDAPPLLKALSLDIQGHNLIQLGHMHRGLRRLNEALIVCKKSKLEDLADGIEDSILSYRSEISVNANESEANLQRKLSTISRRNDYTTAEVILQITKLKVLQGKFTEANNFLINHFEYIFENENKRKIAIANSILGKILIHRGQYLEAISILRVAKQNLDEKTDLSLLLPVLGLDVEALQLLGQPSEVAKEKLNDIVRKSDRYINKRIEQRLHASSNDFALTEDALGNLFDLVAKQDPRAMPKILDNGILYLIPCYYRLRPGKSYLIIDESLGYDFLVTPEEIVPTQGSLTRKQRQLIQLLSQGKQSKQDLVEKIWGYRYSPERHDPLIYSAIARTRKTLRAQANWIETDADRYAFSTDVEVISVVPTSKIEKLPTTQLEEKIPSESLSMGLNYRQINAVDSYSGRFLSANEYAKIWNITRMTAYRDLNQLCEMSHAKVTGRGRSTRYLILGSQLT